MKNAKSSIVFSPQSTCSIFNSSNFFPFIVSHVVFAPHFNLLCGQLSIFICNLSFSPNAMSLSCLLSRHSHCVSPLMEFWSYPFRCSCFSRYLMSFAASSRVPHLFLDLLHVWIVIFSQLSFLFFPFCLTNCIVFSPCLYMCLNIHCHWLSFCCSSESDLVQKFLFPLFWPEGQFWQFNTFSPLSCI